MKTLLNPKYLVLIHHLPVLILFLLFYNHYQLIESLLPSDSKLVWTSIGLTLMIISLIHIGFSTFLIYKRRKLPVLYGLLALAIYVPFLYTYYSKMSLILPFDIPRWMVSDDLHLYAGAFLMPTLAHALFVLVTKSTNQDHPSKAWLNFLIALLIPASWYLFSQFIFPLWRGGTIFWADRLYIFVIILSTILFLFFLVRAIYIAVIKRTQLFSTKQLWWKIPVTIVLPLLGLALNNGHLDYLPESGIFGNFSHPLFYVIAVLNGVLLCLPDWQQRNYRIPLFAGRVITFAFTLYFLLVFLPFLPLSVAAILVFGLGFLMLTPLALFIIHIDQLNRDFNFLKQHYSKRVMWAISGISFLLIPVAIHVNFIQDRDNLQQALAYAYNPDYSATYAINKKELSRTLKVLRQHKTRGNFFLMETQLPYLSAYYNTLVLDNLTLSDRKIDRLEAIFFDAPAYKTTAFVPSASDSVKLSNWKVESNYDEQEHAWRSWLHLEIMNETNLNNQEYSTLIDLPEACWISDYYLWVGDKKEMGQLTEKKAATWVFNQIRNVNRDPGILYYAAENQIAFRVFPFSKKEIRKTGIEFLHKAPLSLNLDGQEIQLGDTTLLSASSKTVPNSGPVQLLNTDQKSQLDTVHRRPYFHFILDASKTENKADYQADISSLLNQYPQLRANAKISFCNAYLVTYPLSSDWAANWAQHKMEGGFYLEHAIRSISAQHYLEAKDQYPVIVLLSDDYQSTILEKDLSSIAFTMPEAAVFHHLNDKKELDSYSFKATHTPLTVKYKPADLYPVLKWERNSNEISYLNIDSEPNIWVAPDFFAYNQSDFSLKSMNAAIWQEAFWRSLQLHPHQYPQRWLDLLQVSFNSRIMSPVSSYIVVENEAQRIMLQTKQAQVLAGNSNFDLEEENNRSMSEPSLWILLVVLGIWSAFKKRPAKWRASIL